MITLQSFKCLVSRVSIEHHVPEVQRPSAQNCVTEHVNSRVHERVSGPARHCSAGGLNIVAGEAVSNPDIKASTSSTGRRRLPGAMRRANVANLKMPAPHAEWNL